MSSKVRTNIHIYSSGTSAFYKELECNLDVI